MIPMTAHASRRPLGARADALKVARRILAGSTKRADLRPSELAEVTICMDQTIDMLERMRPPHIAFRVANALEAAERDGGGV